MLNKEDILKILKKYGFYSLNRAPYIYEDNEHIGVYFIWPNKQYGNLERVFYFKDEKTLEEEVFKYWWFINNKEKYPLEVLFDNYEIVNPNVIYKYKNCIIDIKEIRNFKEFLDSYVDPKEELIKSQLMRTIDIITNILKEKVKYQNEIYDKVVKYASNLKDLTNKFNQKLNEYKKIKNNKTEENEILHDNSNNIEELIKNIQEEINKLTSIDEIRDFINTLANYVKEIDYSNAHYQNLYLLNRYPIEIDDMKKKIKIVEEHLSLKKKIFKGKKDCLEEINNVDKLSECHNLVDVNTYVEEELKKITSFYQEKKDVSEEFLGDYLVKFLNLTIELPEEIDANGVIEEIDQKRLLAHTKKHYEKLSDKEKSACLVASSFLKEPLGILIRLNAVNELNINETISKIILNQKIDLFNDAYQTLDHYINTKIRVKYLSILKMSSFETFMASLVDVIRILKDIEMKIDKSFFAYFVSLDKEVIPLYLKNVFYHGHKTSHIGIINPETPFYYAPIEVVPKIDILDHTELIVREIDTIFILKEKIKTERKDNKLVVVKYEKENSLKTKEYVIITSMKEKNKCTYYEDMIYNKS